MTFGTLSKRMGLVAGIGLLMAATTGASAQYHPGFRSGPFFHGYVGPVYGFAPRFYHGAPYHPGPRFLHPFQVMRALEMRGFRDVNVLHRQGDVFVVNAVSPRSGPTRLIVDAHDAEIIERFAMRSSPRRSPASMPATPRRPEASRLPSPTRPAATPSDDPITGGSAPLPPRRPAVAATPAPQTSTPPAAPQPPVSRRPSDWAPINSVPPSALE